MPEIIYFIYFICLFIFHFILFVVLFWGGFFSHPLVHKIVGLFQSNSKLSVSDRVKYLLWVEIYHECRL